MRLYYSNKVNYLHNTVLLTGTGGVTFRAIQINIPGSTAYYATYKNNIFVANGGTTAYAFYMEQYSTTNFALYSYIDYNNYYSSGNLGNIGGVLAEGAVADLTAWKAKVPTDTHSVSQLPDFINPANSLELASYNYSSTLYCDLDTAVTTDIQGLKRNSPTVMGCYEEALKNADGALSEITGLRKGVIIHGETDTIKVILTNGGLIPLDSVNLGWSLNGVLQTPKDISFYTPLLRGQSDTANFAILTYPPGNVDVKIWINTLKGGTLLDEYLLNDTLSASVFVCPTNALTGIIPINDTSTFSTITAALEAILTCGVGDITLLLDSGIYEENCDFSTINRDMPGNKLTLTSQTGKAEDVIIKPISGAGITLSNTRNLILKDITVDVSTSGTFAIQFTAACTNIVIRDCKLLANPNGTTNAPVYKASQTGIVDSIFFINNLLDGGYYGFYFYGGVGINQYGMGINQYGTNIVFDSNTVSNQYLCGSYIYYVDFSSCSYNTVLSRTQNSSVGWYALYLSYSNGPVIGNRIMLRDNSIAFPYGMAFTYYNSYPVKHSQNKMLIANNEIILCDIYPATNDNYNPTGIYAESSRSKIIHNSIYMTEGYDVVGVLIINPDTVIIKNNNIVSDNPIITTTNLNYYDIDYNNMYALSYTFDMATWQPHITTSTHSVSILPEFIDATKSLELKSYDSLYCNLISDVNTDIQGYNRKSITTMGAYEEILSDVNGALTEILDLEKIKISGQTDTVKVIFTNKGTTPLSTVNLGWSVNGVSQASKNISFHTLLSKEQSDTLTVGAITYLSGNVDVRVWINNLEGGILFDNLSTNDTISASFFVCSNAVTGIISVSDTSNYSTITAALQAVLTCGVGDITLLLDNGIYQENCDLSDINRYMPANSLSITSKTGKAEDVLIKPASGAGMILSNTRNLVLKAITIDVTSGTYAIRFTNACTNIVVRDCRLLANPSTTNSASAPVYKASNTGIVDSIFFVNNLLDGGYCGFYFIGGEDVATQRGTNIVFDSNTISNSLFYGTYPGYTDFISCSYNTVLSRITDADATWYGLIMYYSHGPLIGNRIIQRTNTITNPCGIYCDVHNLNFTNYGVPYRSRTLIANNEIILNATNAFGIYTSNARSDILHNSIYISGSEGFPRGIAPALTANEITVVKNNNIVLTATSAYPVYLSGITGYDIDYNNYYAPTYIGYCGVDVTTMSTWRQMLATDQHSTNILPAFIDLTKNLKIADYSSLYCNSVPAVTTDIENAVRLPFTAMGCYEEQNLKTTNGALREVLGLEDGKYAGTKDSIYVVFFNAGLASLDTVDIAWAIDGISQGHKTIIYSHSLTTGQQDTIFLSEFIYAFGTNNVQVWINHLNGGTAIDEFLINDTVKSSAIACSNILGGIITVSKTGTYNSIKQALDVLSVCNMSSDITLILDTGVYEENVDIMRMNLSGNYSLTLTSKTGNPADVIIRSSARTVVDLVNSNNVSIENITIDATQGPLGIELIGICSNIVIDNCIILSNAVTNNATAGIYKSGAGLNGLTVKNCSIQGGYYGVCLYGTSADYCQNITIDSNIITGQYRSGAYLYYVNLNSVSYNQVMPRSSDQRREWCGLYFHYAQNGGNIIGNRISADNSGIGVLYGMSIVRMDSALVGNNEIYLHSSGYNTYGMFLDSSKAVAYVHNTVLLTGPGGSIFRAVQLNVSTSASYNATYMNNIFVANGGPYPYAIFMEVTPDATFALYNHIDYNTYYSSGDLGYAGSAQADLAAWKSTVPTDNHSVSRFPAFTDITTNLKLSDYTNLLCPFYPGITKDIEGNIRADRTTMGAYTDFRTALDLGIEKIICENVTNVSLQSVPVKIGIVNAGNSSNINNATFGWSVNGERQPAYTWNANIPLAPQKTIELPLGTMNVSKTSVFDITVWIESVNGSKDAIQWDDTAKTSVRVFFPGSNLSARSIEQLVADSVLCPNDYVPLKVKVENSGALDYDFAANPVTFSIRVNNPELFSFDTVFSTGKIKSGESVTLELTDMFPIVVAGVYDIEVFLNSLKNTIQYDDTIRTYYTSGKFGLPIDEDFSSGMPVAFISKGLNTSHTWKLVSQGTGVDATVQPVFGDSILSFTGSPGSMTTLSTQRLDLSRTVQPALSFWYFHDTLPCEDYTDVRITIDGGTTYTTLYSLTKYDAVYGWRQYNMDLPSYAVNQCVILTFEAMEKSRSGDITQYIDRIRVIAKQDIAVTKVFASEYSICDLENKDLKVVLSNLTDPVLNYTDTLMIVTLEVKETGQTFTKTLTSGTIPGFSSDTITLATGFNLTKGTYTCKAYFTSLLDVNRNNDTLVTTLTVNPELSLQINQASGGNTNCLTGETDVFQSIIITNTGNMDLFDIELVLQIDTGETGSPAYFTLTEICTDIILAGSSFPYTFKSAYKAPWKTDYYPRIYAHLTCDTSLINTTIATIECVDAKDLYMVKINNLSASADRTGSLVQVQATLGNHDDLNYYTGLNITVVVTNSQGGQTEKFTEMTAKIGMSSTATHSFSRSYTIPNDTIYYLTVYLDSYDNYLSNDTLTIKRTTDYTSIDAIESAVFSLGQNIPNPANNNTRIDYSVPDVETQNIASLLFQIHSITGQLLYSKTIKATRGANSLELNTSTFAAGVYFYSMEYKGQRLVRQLIIEN
jgi:hypothetical protein